MATKSLNWGLLSTANINRKVMPAIKASSRNHLQAVASRDAAAAEAYAREWKIPRAHGSYEALLADPEIDVIYIGLPNHLHAEWTIRALRAGKHVLCEKPLALTTAEVDAMTMAATESGKVLAEAFMYRHHPQTLKVKETVEQGTLGKLQLMKSAFTFTLTRTVDIRLNKELGGGSIWDLGCYPVSYVRLIAGHEPVEAFGWQSLGEGGADVSFVGQLRFPGDVFAQFDVSFTSPARQALEIVGSQGVLNVPTPFQPTPNETILLRRGDKRESIGIRGSELYSGEVEDMAEAILGGRRPRVSLAYSRGNAAALVALLESARSGKPVLL